ncbi:hypothetical protein M0R72_16625 [Candidatus Pacearchaeota archaeon]|nr:hypothetical protein [Candidatus Pacearchaeota archaeon]
MPDTMITREEQNAVELIEANFMDVKTMQKELGITSYQYARTLIVEDRFGLGSSATSLFGRTLVHRQAVAAAKSAREERAQNAEANKEAKAAAKAEAKEAKKAAKKSKKAVEPDEPAEALDDLIS